MLNVSYIIPSYIPHSTTLVELFYFFICLRLLRLRLSYVTAL